MKKFNFLADRTGMQPAISTKAPRIRRTGIGRIIAQLQLKHPNASEQELHAMAKHLWHAQRSGGAR